LNFDLELGHALSYARICFGCSVVILRCCSRPPLVLSLTVRVFSLVSVAALGIEAVGEDSQPAAVKQSPLVSSSKESHVIEFAGPARTDVLQSQLLRGMRPMANCRN